jgi:hypothetical protein
LPGNALQYKRSLSQQLTDYFTNPILSETTTPVETGVVGNA